MSLFDTIRMYWWIKEEIQRDRDTLAGVPRSRPRERRLRQLTLYTRILVIHRPSKDSYGKIVCVGCILQEDWKIEYSESPCEHVALIAFAYADRPGFNPEWTKPYAWAVAP